MRHGEENVIRQSNHTLASRSRRSFLRDLGSAAAFLLAGDAALARPLLLILANGPSKIAALEWVVYATGRHRPDGQPEHRCAVRITCEDGAQGWADLADSVTPDRDTASLIRDALLARNPSEHSVIWRQLHDYDVSPAVLAGVDVALWDLLGRTEGKPVHALVGTRRQDVKACVSTGFDLAGPEEYAAAAAACKEKGLHGCKVQLRTGSPDRDIAVYKAVREAVGPDFPSMADSSSSYTYDQALRVGLLLDELAYKWWESPMPEGNEWRDRYTSLAAQVRTPICAPRTDPDSHLARVPWITAKACDVGAMDVLRGGFTACLEFAGSCEAAGIPLQLSNIGPDSYPHLQLIAATSEPLIEYFEVSSPARESPTLPGRLTPEPTFDEQGRVPIPQTPGMALDLDWKYIFTHRVA
ncbi:MAG: hypothetical protein A2Y77_06640 [Planctomycetes bacterium RBG_13_62_9]|nr:MAG: hypothetical protein A2Y77_06640 [Planctomycetes bacterium RBG_13_62_9]